MAALRNLAICALRLSGRTDVTEATRWAPLHGPSLHHPRPHIMILERPCHTSERWVLLYISRWLTAPMQMPDGTMVARERGPAGFPDFAVAG